MRWRRGRGKGMIEDRRGEGSGSPLGELSRLGGSFRLPRSRGGSPLGIGSILVFLLVAGVVWYLSSRGDDGSAPDPAEDELADFVGFVVEDVQTFWQTDFVEAGRTYQVTKLVLFDGQTETACGLGTEETGPFYCPGDRKVYIDLGFFRELAEGFGAPGDFAQAYVIAHEFGHHVQTLLGTERRVREAQERSPGQANELSVRMELQADCLAGVWASSAQEERLLEVGDLEEGLAAAASVGDDRIQRSAGERVDPETWTHGSAAQRKQWFTEGFEGGEVRSCDTFGASI